MDIESLRPAIAELERAAEWFFTEVSPDPLVEKNGTRGSPAQKLTVVIQTKGRRPRCMGYFLNRDAGSGFRTREGEGVHQISISSEYLNREVGEIIETLIHECVHLWCWSLGVKDTSSGGLYHNRKFKTQAELVGMVCPEMSVPGIGYGFTKLGEELEKRIREELAPDVAAFGVFQAEGKKGKSQSKTVAWVCECSPVLTARFARGRVVDVECRSCGAEFVRK